MRTSTFLVASLVVAAAAAPCPPDLILKVKYDSNQTPEGQACVDKLSIPASAYGNPATIAEYYARLYESTPVCQTWWPILAANLKAISPVCDVRPGFSTQDYAALSFKDMVAEIRLQGALDSGQTTSTPSNTASPTNAPTTTTTTKAPTTTTTTQSANATNNTVTTPVPATGSSDSSASTSSSTTAAPTTTKAAPSSGSIVATTALSCLALVGFALQ
ncbi:hypothetical protein AC1031_019013 [Aphanomyces cochlioides]|nr:hypothetical protein AC1031_019013 [Aphanomyces cochlioides]